MSNNRISQPPVAEADLSRLLDAIENAMRSLGNPELANQTATGRMVLSGDGLRYVAELRQRLSEYSRVDPASSITEKARQIALKLKRDADDTFAMPVDDEPIVTQWADIIVAEFGADAAPSSTRSTRSTRPSQPRST